MKKIFRCLTLPLYTQVLIAVACGALLGVVFGQEPYLGGMRNEHLGGLGMLVVTLLKTLAIPLIFFAILDALIRTSLPLRQGTKLLLICLVNVSVAMTIGLVIMNTWQPGLAWYGHVDELLNVVPTAQAIGGHPYNSADRNAESDRIPRVLHSSHHHGSVFERQHHWSRAPCPLHRRHTSPLAGQHRQGSWSSPYPRAGH